MIQIKAFTFNPFQENTYLLYDETGECIIIDPGNFNANEHKAMQQFIEQHNLKVTTLVNTHCHIDHVLGNFFVKETYKVKLGIHAIEEPYLKAVKTYAPNYGFHQYQETAADYFIEEGTTVRFGKSELAVLFAPGHSAGHIVFYSKDQDFCIAGDVLFRESIGRTDLPGGDHATLLASIRKELFTLPDHTVVYPGHGPSTTIGHEKKHNPFL
jgi:hydroxyacylglutathione hydrolase